MRNIRQLFFCMTAAVLALGAWAWVAPATVKAERIDKIIAIVNEDVITEDELKLFIKMLAANEQEAYVKMKPPELKRMLLERMIEDRLIIQEAKRLKIVPEEKMIQARIDDVKARAGGQAEFEAALKAEGITFSELRQKLANQFLVYQVIEREVKSKLNVSPKDVTDYFQKHRDKFFAPATREVDSIFVKDPAALETVLQELGDRKPFADVAKAFSEKSNIEEVSRGQLKKGLEDFIFELGVGVCSRPFATEDGFYVFLVKEDHPAAAKNLSEVKDFITAELEKIQVEKLLKEWLLTLRQKAYISIRE
ncbi:MAG: peptidyl-prolyl cis-trans isomerase [Candidatus Omnitrophota bacterium]